MEIQHPDRMRLKSCHLVGVTVETLLLIAVAVFGVFICVFRNPFKEGDLSVLDDLEILGKPRQPDSRGWKIFSSWAVAMFLEMVR